MTKGVIPSGGQPPASEQHRANRLNVALEQPKSSSKIQVNQGYLRTIRGILRMALIVSLSSVVWCCALYQHVFAFKLSLTAGWISAAAIQRNTVYLNRIYDLQQTRLAYIIIAVIGEAFTILIFVFFLLSLDNVKPMDYINVSFIVLILDAIWFIMMLVLGIICAVKEGVYSSRMYQTSPVNQGAFGSAAFFAFAAVVLYAVSCVIEFRKTLKVKSENIEMDEGDRRTASTM